MSRAINTSLATIQFQVNARQASAAMQALQDMANDLNSSIDKVNRNIANLGKDVPKDNPQLLNYQSQLAGLKKDLKDVEKAQRDFLKGAKAADQLWQAAQQGNIESLSFRSIKAGINGLKKRQEGLSPGDAQDMKDWRIIKEVIDEADRVVKQAGADVQNVVQTIREGGKVSEQAMRQTINTLKELKGSVDETDADFRTYGNDLDFMEAKLQEFSEAQRRAKGEIVDANDARREMNKLTEEGRRQAEFQKQQAEWEVNIYQQANQELDVKRQKQQAAIDQTKQQMDAQQQLIEEKHRELEANERAHIIIQDANHAHIEGLKTRAEQERKLANQMSDDAEQQRRVADLQKQTTEQLTEKVTELQGKLAALNAEPVKPKVDSTDIDALKKKLEQVRAEKLEVSQRLERNRNDMGSLVSGDSSTWEHILEEVKGDKKGKLRAMWIGETQKQFDDVLDVANRFYNIVKKLGTDLGSKTFSLDATEPIKKLAEQYKITEEEARKLVRTLIESAEVQKKFSFSFDERFGLNQVTMQQLKDKERDSPLYSNKTDQQIRIESAESHYKNAKAWEERRAKDVDELAKKEKELYQQESDLTEQIKKAGEATGKQADATKELTEAQRLYNEAVERRKQKEQELKEIQERSYNDDPEVKRINEEIAKLEELIAVTDKYKKQFTKMSDKKFEEGYMGDDAEVKKHFRTGLDPTKYIYGAEDYLASAYRDRFNANFHKLGIRKPGDDGYEKDAAAADRVAKGIVENAQEALRRAILHEIEDGTLSSASMEEMVENFRSKMYQAAREAGEGNLKDDPEYNTYKYIIAQMEKYLEVAKKVEEERAKIAGGGEFLEMARYKDDINAPREGLLRQREKHEFQDLTGWGDFKRRQEEAEDRKSQEVTQAKNDEKEAERQLNEEKAKSNQQSEEELRLKGELETAQGKLAESKKRENDEQQKYTELQGKAIEQGNKAAKMETELADAQSESTQKQADFNQKQQEGLDNINQMGQGYETLKTQLEGQEQALADAGKQMAENNQHIAESEAKKKQAQELTIKRMEEMIAALRKENNEVIPANTEKWRENEAEINRLSGALEKLKETARIDLIKTQGAEALSFFEKDAAGRSQADTASAAETAEKVKALAAYRDVLPKDTDAAVFERIDEILEEQAKLLKETTGEWMSYEDAKELASKAGGEGFLATTQQMQQAVQAMERQRDALIKTIQLKQKDGKATADEEAQLEKLEKELKDLKFEQDNFNMSHEKMQMLMRTPTNAVSLDELRAAIKRADGELKRMEGSLGQNNKQYQEFAAQVKNAKNQLKEMEGQAKATSMAWEKAWSRLKTYVGMYMGFNMAWQKVTGTADDLLELSDKMGEVRKTTGFTADEVGRLSDNLAKLDTRTDLTGLMEFSSLAGSIGMKTQEQVQGFTEAANMLAVSLPEMGNEASRTLMKIADATGDLEKNGGNVRETLERVGSTIIALRANSAAAAGPITDFVSRVGAVGAQAGISIDQIAALGATVDALGGRVEMSATALSRMIPAIKNNTFEVAKAIGMTEKELKGMTGMEQMVAIFRKLHDSAKGFDTSTEEGMNAMADSVEKALGRSTSMQEVMKELNQQGARAGIVFGLLSQNVDKLEEQLDTASNAYKDNMALMNEYNKMNDTAAAKWARLKNQLEEFFVSAENTSWLSGIIDKLRWLVDLLTDEGPIGGFFRYSLVYLALLKAKWAEAFGSMLISIGKFLFATKASTAASAADTAAKTAEAAATEAVGNASADAAVKTGLFAKAWGKMNAAMRANIITAVAIALYFLGSKLIDVAKKSREATQRIDQVADAEKKAREESIKERAELEKLYKVAQDRNKSLEERKKALHDMVGDEKYNQYYKDLANESELAKAAANEYSNLTTEIVKAAKARAYQQKITELTEKNLALEDKRDEAKKYVDENKASYERVSTNVANSPTAAGMFGMTAAAAQEHNDGRRQFLRDYEAKQQDIITNQEEMKKNDEDILKLETKISNLNLKPQGDGGNGGGGGGGGSTPYGDYNKVTSPYSQWNGDDLVARRKEMLERVRALANGADVQKVLSEDAKFISDAVRKNIKTTSDAIEWYNTERLKIQEALHAKHLTNTGDWMDPKQQKIRRKLMQDDMKAYLEELDAYYTERKTEIERARNDEEISEAEAWNRNIKNEAEWHKRRAELQIMYSNKHKQVAEDEQDVISAIVAERTGDDAKYIKATIANTRKFSEAVKAMNEQGAKEYRKFQGDLDLGAEKDWNKVQKALMQHLKAIEEIVNKERPFNGIAKNMQVDLGKMGILTADLAEGADSAAEELKRITFLLGEAENAYTMTVEKLLDDMRKNGFKEWADVISKDPSMQQGLLSMLRQTFDAVQDAIKKESSIIKKQVEIMMQDITEQVQADTTRMQILQNSVSRANSLIGAGTASERVADKLAIKQVQLQITMQETRIRMLKKAGADRVALLNQEAELLQKQGKTEEAKQKRMDAENVDKSVGLTLTKEQVELDKQRVALSEKLEETQNRLYTELREWASLLTSSMQSIFEASHAGDADYYNELAKLNLTGKGGPGAGTYIVIDNEGTEDATAHYEYLNQREALERQHEIEIENARAEAWKKVWDDINMKINDSITDWMNAYLQNQSIDANTAVVDANTLAIKGLTEQLAQGLSVNISTNSGGESPAETPADNGFASDKQAYYGKVSGQNATPGTPTLFESSGDFATDRAAYFAAASGATDPMAVAQVQMDANNAVTQNVIDNKQRQVQVQTQGDKQIATSNQSTIAKMIQATNLYGVAYQAMSNDNLDAAQKFQMIALQAVGNVAMVGLQVALTEAFGKTAVNEAQALSKDNAENGSILGPILWAIGSALVGGLMGLAASKIASSKSQIAQMTGASVGAGRLATGMLTYAEGNVNEFTDPGSLTPGRHYNVDGADGKTYRAKYMGEGAKTHITNGPEFHLVGEAGREAIIDAHTTRNIQMNEPEIWRTIQTLYNGGSLRHTSTRRGRGVRAFADGNLDEFEMADGGGMMAESGFDPAMLQGFQQSLDRNSAIMEQIAANGIEAFVSPYGPRGIVAGYDKGKKEAMSHGEKHL